MPDKDVLDSWKEICAYIGRSEKTCRRLEKELGLPVHRLEETPKARVYAYKNEIDLWIQKTQHSDELRLKEQTRLGFKTKYLLPSILIVLAAILILVILLFKTKLFKETISLSHKQLTFTGNASYPTISPDGKFIAYVNQEAFDEKAIVIQDIVSGHSVVVHRVQNCHSLRWMPDSSELCFSGKGRDSKYGITIIPRLGGKPRRLPSIPIFTISPDGSRFAGSNMQEKKIVFLDKITSETKSIPLVGDFNWLIDIDWSPLEHLILFLTRQETKNTLWTINTDGSNQQKVIEKAIGANSWIWSPRWSPKGDAIFYYGAEGQNKGIFCIPVSPETGKPLRPSYLVQPVHQVGINYSISGDGKRSVYTRELSYANLWLAAIGSSGDSLDATTQQLTTGTIRNRHPAISPDGRQIVFSMGDDENTNIYVMPIEGGTPTQITFLDSYCYSPVWSPDGRHIAFGRVGDGTIRIWKVSVGGGQPFQFTESELSNNMELSWAPGTEILYQRPGNRNFYMLNPETGEETPLLQDDSVGWIFSPRYSPDGKKVVIYWNRTDESPGIYIISLADSSSIFVKKGYFHPIGWSDDERWIYSYEKKGGAVKIFMIEINSKEEKTVMTIPLSFEMGEPADISMIPGGKGFIISVKKTNSDVWLIENFNSAVK